VKRSDGRVDESLGACAELRMFLLMDLPAWILKWNSVMETGLHHVPESSGTPDDVVAQLRDLPLPICLHQFGTYDAPCNKEVVRFVCVGVATLPDVHGDEVGANDRCIGVYGNVVPSQKVL
jgi:hypothetical protein